MRDTWLLHGLPRVEDPGCRNASSIPSAVALTYAWIDVGPGLPDVRRECAKHDHRERVRRDLDCAAISFISMRSFLTVTVSWSTGRSEFAERLERIAIALLLKMLVAAVAQRMEYVGIRSARL